MKQQSPGELVRDMRKTTGVRLDFSDGSYRSLTGEAAEKWQAWVDQVCLLAHFHGQNPNWNSLPWETGQGSKGVKP